MGYEKQRELDRQDKQRGRGRSNSQKLSFNDYQFMSVELSRDQKTECRQDVLPHLDLLYAMDQMVVSGYKLSVSWTDGGRTVVASLSCTDAASPDAGLVLTARGPALFDAVGTLYYKYAHVIGERFWREYMQDTSESATDIG